MSTGRTAWHVVFAALVKERAPPDVEVRAEVQLGAEPQRVDLLLLRKTGDGHQPGAVLGGLWPLFTTDALVEFKSVARPFRRGDLVRLLGYGAQYHVGEVDRLTARDSLTLVLVLSRPVDRLASDLTRLGWHIEPIGDGYARIVGCPYPLVVVDIDTVAVAEHDDLLGAFGHHTMENRESHRWWQEHVMAADPTDIRELEGYEEMRRKLVESLSPEERLAIVAGLGPADRLAGLGPAERLAGLGPAERLAAVEQLVETLPADLRAALRRRLGED